MVTLSSRRRERIEQLAGFLDGTLDEGEVRSDVRRLATLASTVSTEIELPTLAEDERDRIRTRVMAAVHTDLQAAEAERTGTARAPRSARAAVATGVASVIIGTGGVAVAAQEALPGDTLYGIKQATESVRVAAAGDLTEQGRLELALAAERLDEVTAAVERGGVRESALIDTLSRMDERSRAGAEALVRVAERSGEQELLEEVAAFTEQQAGGIVAVFDQLPVAVRPHAEDSLATLRVIREELLAPVLGRAVEPSELAAIESLLRSSPLPAAPAVQPADADADADETTTGTSTAPSTSAPTTGDGTGGGSTGTSSGPVDPAAPALPLPSGDTNISGGRNVVPRLPGPLDDVGKAVDETVGGVVDGTGKLLEDTTKAVDDVLEGTGDAVGGLLDGALGGVGGLLGGGNTP